MPMSLAMSPTALLSRTLQLAMRSWRGQLVVLALGSLLLGLTLMGASDARDLELRALAAWFDGVLLVGLSVRAAIAQVEELQPEDVLDELLATIMLVPRLLAHALVACLPTALAVAATLAGASIHPLLGLLLVVPAFAVAIVAAAPVLLAIVGVVLGEQSWMPNGAFAAMRRAPARLALAVLVGCTAAAMAAVPFVLVGMVIGAQSGVLGIVGTGLGAASVLPWLGCGALALWQVSGAQLTQAAQSQGPAADSVDIARAFGQAAAEGWVAGPSWDAVVQPGVPWGTWVSFQAAATVGLQVEWSGGSAPRLLLCGEDGQWWSPGALASSGALLPAAVAQANVYVQLECTGTAPQAVSLVIQLPAAQAA